MKDQDVRREDVEGEHSDTDEWSEIEEEFKALGKRLASAISSEFQSEENRRRLTKLESDINEMAEEISQAVERATASPQAEEMRSDVRKVVDSAREVGQRVAGQARPYLLSALRSINRGLQEFATRLEGEGPETKE